MKQNAKKSPKKSQKKKLPFFSVVVCCYNGADVLPQALKALQAQKYSGRMEIIVVDDGSKDDTYEVAKSFKKIRVIRNVQNKGIAGARNVGITAAKGDIIAFTDDDCRPAPSWIKELAAAYDNSTVLGAGGGVVSTKPDNMILRYLHESKPLKPLENSLLVSKKLTYRFGLYLKGLAGKIPQPKNGRRSVYSLVGASMSFRKTALQEIGLFDERFRFGGEEEDVCKRLNELHPASLLFMPKAKMRHQYERTLRDTLRRSRAYAKGNARMYYKHADVKPVIFPFPLALIASTALGFISPWLFLTPVALVPVIYSRWTMYALSNRQPEGFLYGYIQISQEWYANLGFAQGWWQYRKLFQEERAISISRIGQYVRVVAMVTALAGGLVLARDINATWLRCLVGIFAVFVPGRLLLQAVGMWTKHTMERMALSIALGVALLMALSIIMVSGLPLLHVVRPLTSGPLLVSYAAAIALLAAFALRHDIPARVRSALSTTNSTIAVYVMAAALPFCTFMGAMLLNAGRSNVLSIGVFGLASVAVAFALWRQKYLSRSALPLLLFSISVSVLWSYSLRSAYLFGWDIQQEYAVFQATHAAGQWSIGQLHTPYDAMLSLTTLPTMLSNMTSLNGLALLKVLYPVFFSFVPVVAFYAYRLFAKRWIAFVAALITVGQFYYMQQFSALARQQVAFLFFAVMVYALLAKKWRRGARYWIAALAIFGLVVSHYSTTYMTIAMLGAVYIGAKLVMLMRRTPLKQLFAAETYVHWWVVLAIVLGAFVWYVPATHSSGSFRKLAASHSYMQVARNTVQKVEKYFTSTTHPQARPTPTAPQYLKTISTTFRTSHPYFRYYAEASDTSVSAAKMPIVAHKTGLYQASRALDVIVRYGWWLLGLGVAALYVLRLRKQFSEHALEISMLFGVAGVGFIAGHVIPNLSKYYNIPRLNQQMLMILALPAVLGLVWLVRKLSATWQRAAVGAVAIATVLLASGVITQFAGGNPVANLNNYGSDYQRFYVHSSETTAAQWLQGEYNGKSPVFADEYATLRLTSSTMLRHRLMNVVTPETIATGSYVYADYTNTVDKTVAIAADNGITYTYDFPTSFLQQNKNVLYTNGQSEIYR